MTNVEGMSKHECPNRSGQLAGFDLRHWELGILSSLGIRHSSFATPRLPTFDVQRSMLDVRCSFYSYRSASIGSTLAARRAGRKQANNATAASSTAMPQNVSGSVELIP